MPGPHCCGRSSAPQEALASLVGSCLQRRKLNLGALEEAPAAGQGPPVQGLALEFAGQGAPGGAGARLLEAAAACCVAEALEQLILRLAGADQAEVAPQAPRSCRRQVSVRMLAIACQSPLHGLIPGFGRRCGASKAIA